LTVHESEPSWSPDGRQIAYVSDATGAAEIWVVQRDGTYPTQLTSNGASNTHPAWSPDSKRIAFVSDKGGTKDIWIMNADASGQARIVALPGEENCPSFSPTGDKLVFSETSDGTATLMVADVDGSNVHSITSTGYQDWEPNWGPNGIVFSSNRDRSSEHWKLWVVQPDGTGLRNIADTIGLTPWYVRDGRILFTDELMATRAQSTIGIVNPATGAKQIAVNVQGYVIPIDIRPDAPINNINPGSRGQIEVGILSTRTFDATVNVKQATITFGRTGSEKSLAECSKAYVDLNGDGLRDLRCKFWIQSTGFRQTDTVGILRFIANDGTPYEGRDSITIVNSGE
jgi:dipeptidyl aminopeptidase/acylaminoacyl peptidase